MNKIIVLPILLGLGIVISASILLFDDKPSESTSSDIYDSGFTYYDIEKIQNSLAKYDVFVSSPTAIRDHTISQYCKYFENGLPKNVGYCTTTAVLDAEGTTIGNINMGGDTSSPILAIANLETTSIDENKEQVFMIFETMIETLVCDCWEEAKSHDFENIPSWLDEVHTFYINSDNRNIKSKIDNLEGNEIIFEITTKDNSVLQTLIILK